MKRSREWLTYEAVRRHLRGESNRAIGRVLAIDRRTVAKLLHRIHIRLDLEILL